MELTVVVGTFGDETWKELARERAIPSAEGQAPVIHVHDDTLAASRNRALTQVESEWVCFLDADDELAPDYIEAMDRASADVRVPVLRFMPRAQMWQPRVFAHEHDCVAECVTSGQGNWIPAGTCARTELVRAAGGWREWPLYEDFDLWMRVLLGGASVELVRDAVYVAHVRPDSRNRAPSNEEKVRVHHEIVASNLAASERPLSAV